ncbi:MAG: diguanylate cyclase [Lachnospiraceae bacterium]|nr:diguanylate cyclase [Lachnospiraceae bacterium]
MKDINSQLNNLIPIAFQTMLDNTEDMVFVKDVNSVYITASEPFVKMVGKKKVSDIVNKTDFDIFEDKELAKRYVDDDKKLLGKGKDLVNFIEPITELHGHARYGATSKFILKDEDGNQIGILGITRDITRDYIARQHYQQELAYLFELPVDTYAVTYIDVDDWRVISQRKQAIGDAKYQNVNTVEELCDFAVESIVDKESKAAEFYKTFSQEMLHEIFESGRSIVSFEYQRILSNGDIRWVKNEIRFMTEVDSGHLCVMLSAKDISEIKSEEQQLVLAAKMDQMTMLYNRETTMDYIRQILQDEPDGIHALFMIDVDNFKGHTDTRGHQVGDEFLVELAADIKRNFRDSDVVGRIGGDEFFALMKNVPDISVVIRKAGDLLSTAQNVCGKFPDVGVSASVGISLYPQNGTTMEELYAEADAALYEAKRKGKNQYIFA